MKIRAPSIVLNLREAEILCRALREATRLVKDGRPQADEAAARMESVRRLEIQSCMLLKRIACAKREGGSRTALEKFVPLSSTEEEVNHET